MQDNCSLPAFESRFKVSIVGCGNVGAAAAYALLIDGTPTELVLIDRDKEKAEGLCLDYEHSMAFFENTKVTGSDDVALCKDSNLIVVTAGARQKEGETRLDLVAKNKALFADLIPRLAKVAPQAILLIVSNPVDVLTREAVRLSGFPRNRVFGTGTMLDTARLRFHIGERLCINPKSVDAFILGEHGDSSFPVWSVADIGGKPLLSFPNFTELVAQEVYDATKNAAYRIIHDVGYTCYSIGIVIREVVKGLFKHSREVLPLSVLLEGEYGYEDVALSVPCILDSTGIAGILDLPLNAKEKEQLDFSVATLKNFNA